MLKLPQAPLRPETFEAKQALHWPERQQTQPIVPFHSLDDPLQAMGVALFHIGSAVLDYLLIRESIPGGVDPRERYANAENDARVAHRILHQVHSQLSNHHPTLSPEIRKYCRMANVLLTEQRREAAIALGIDPPPQCTDDLQHEEIDHDHRNDMPEEGTEPDCAGDCPDYEGGTEDDYAERDLIPASEY